MTARTRRTRMMSINQRSKINEVLEELGEQPFEGDLSFDQASEYMTELFARNRDRRAQARREESAVRTSGAPDIQPGRYRIQATVISVKWGQNSMGAVRKMTVQEDDGNRYWCTLPEAIAETAPFRCEDRFEFYRGLRIDVGCVWTPSRDDAHFAFGKRPVIYSIEWPAESEALRSHADYDNQLFDQARYNEAERIRQVNDPSNYVTLALVRFAQTGSEEQFNEILRNYGQGLTLDYMTEFSRENARIARTRGLLNLFKVLAGKV